jgi:hypothetical protein
MTATTGLPHHCSGRILAAMNTHRTLVRSTLVLLAALGIAAHAAQSPELTDDGLQPVKVRNIDKAYKRPGASLKGYDRILIRPVTVAFSKHWDARNYGGTFGLKPADVEEQRSSLSKLADKTFARVLSRGGYPVVESAGAGVLEVEAQIVDLFINGPEVPNAGIQHTYVLSFGEMRLLVTLRDSVTGTTLYRVSDFYRDADTGRLEWANRAWNNQQAEIALSAWARQLKKALDAAKAE